MAVQIEELGKFDRKITATVPAAEVKTIYTKKLAELSKQVHMKGFRKGKVPASVVKTLHGKAVTNELRDDVRAQYLKEAFDENKFRPVQQPEIEDITQLQEGQDYQFTVRFETAPTIELVSLADKEIEVYVANVTDEDVDASITELASGVKEWEDTDSPADDTKRAVIDFEGSINGELFEGGKAEDFPLELGQGRMIPGFEEGIIGKKAGDEFTIDVTFPDEYGAKNLAGKAASFKIKVKSVQNGVEHPINDELAEKLQIHGGLEALKKETLERLKDELVGILNALTSDRLDELLDAEYGDIDIPARYLETRIESEKKHTTTSDSSDEEIKIKVEKQVKNELIQRAIIEAKDIQLDQSLVQEKAQKFMGLFEMMGPKEAEAQLHRILPQLQMQVMREQLNNAILSDMKKSEKSVSYKEAKKTVEEKNKQK